MVNHATIYQVDGNHEALMKSFSWLKKGEKNLLSKHHDLRERESSFDPKTRVINTWCNICFLLFRK